MGEIPELGPKLLRIAFLQITFTRFLSLGHTVESLFFGCYFGPRLEVFRFEMVNKLKIIRLGSGSARRCNFRPFLDLFVDDFEKFGLEAKNKGKA